MNLPNQLSLARLFLCAGLVAVMSVPWAYSATAALILFAVASFTDWLDGYIARKYNLITDLGKLLDPLADKIMVSAAFIALVAVDLIPMWMVVVIIAREFLITGLRMVAAAKNFVLAAERAGKHKTVTQILAILASFSYLSLGEFGQSETDFAAALAYSLLPLYWLALLITVWSGALYFYKNRTLFAPEEIEAPAPPPEEVNNREEIIKAKQAAAVPGPFLDPQVGTPEHVHDLLEIDKTEASVTTSPAFKEWHVIVEALGAGAQTLILRKGGIAEGRGGFKPEHERFWLFPTQYHEQVASTKPEAEKYSRFDPPTKLDIPLKYYAEITDAVFLEDPEALAVLEPFHLWTPETIQERFDWSKQSGVHLLVLRVYRSRLVRRLKDSKDYGGCKSWIQVPVDLDQALGDPVMADEEFRTRRSRLLAAIPQAAKA